MRWLTGKSSLTDLAWTYRMTRRGLSKRFQPHFALHASDQIPHTIHTLIVDGMRIHGRLLVVLVALTDQGDICWSFATQEDAIAWHTFLCRFPRPTVVVCDGQKGLSKALNGLWPQISLQRCHFHIAQLARRYLTRHPRTDAGCDAKVLIRAIPRVSTLAAAQAWRQSWGAWEERYGAVLSERTRYTDGARIRWWYTHRNLRGIRSLIRGALPHLFTFLQYPGTPNTTNHVEGGVNAMIAEALRLHRGLRIHQKKTLVSLLLAGRNRRKNATRKFS